MRDSACAVRTLEDEPDGVSKQMLAHIWHLGRTARTSTMFDAAWAPVHAGIRWSPNAICAPEDEAWGCAAAGVWPLPTSKPCARRSRRRERIGTSRAGPTICHASGISRWLDGADLAIVQSASAATTTAPSHRCSGRGSALAKPPRLDAGMQRTIHMPPGALDRHAGQGRQSPKRARYAVWKHTSIWMAGPSHSA